MTSRGERPSKRFKSQPRIQLKTGQASTIQTNYLSDFAKKTTIAVFLAPLRQRQAEIISRNLIEAGAAVIESSAENVGCQKGANELNADLLVVTDDLSKAKGWVKSAALEFQTVRYVSTKWASKVLSTQSLLSIENYRLDNNNVITTKKPASTSASSLKLYNKFIPPVWCARGNEQSNHEEILSQLPSHLCQRSTITQSIYRSPNYDLCIILDKLAKKRLLEFAGGDQSTADIRARAYRLAAAALKCVPFKLVTKHDANYLRSFGPRVLAVVNEYLTTGCVVEANQFETDVRLKAISRFADLYGIGSASARHLYDSMKIHSIPQLQARASSNPDEFSKEFLKYFSQYNSIGRIDISSARAFKQKVEDLANSPSHPLHLRMVLCGGFRRGEHTGHDIDLLYCRKPPHENDSTSVLGQLITRLKDDGLLVTVLSLNSNTAGHREKHYHKESLRTDYAYSHDIVHALARFDNRTFRLDIVGVRSASEFPYATLAWSGSTPFQRDLRQYCEKRNWIFNQHGVFNRASGARINFSPTPGSEADIFAAIDLVYRPPFERSC